MDLSRRAFLAGCGTAGIGAMFATLPMRWDDIYRIASETPLMPGSRVLVLLTMYGGNDGMNTVIPYTNNAYFDARPELAYAGQDVIDLDGEYGLNPGMGGLGKLFNDGSLAIVRGVGYPDQDRSHFRSMDIWQTGSVDNGVTTGWIGRWLDMTDQDPLRAIHFGATTPTLAIGAHTTAATVSLDSLSSRSSDHAELVTALSKRDPRDNGCLTAVCDSYRAAAKVDREFAEVFGDYRSPESDRRETPNSLAAQLNVVSRCVRAGLPTAVYCVSIDGFDTHADEKSKQQKLLRTVDKSLTKFLKEMSTDERGRNVVVMAYSEFGRRVSANASDGTDHGTSGPVFVAGVPVRGGFYGDDPSLTDLANDDLKTTTDFRDIYAEFLVHIMGVDPAPIIGSNRKPIGFLN